MASDSVDVQSALILLGDFKKGSDRRRLRGPRYPSKNGFHSAARVDDGYDLEREQTPRRYKVENE